MRFHILSLSMMAIAFCVATTTTFAADTTHDGKVVGITDTELVMTDEDQERQTLKLADDVSITLDGKDCEANELRAGTKIRVTTQRGQNTIATKIEAIRKNATFGNSHDGKLVSMDAKSFEMTGQDGKKHSHTLASNAKVTCDGKPCKLSDLKAGMKIRVTTSPSDKNSAVKVQALDKDTDFVPAS